VERNIGVNRRAQEWHTGYDDQGRPFEVTTFVMRADRSALDYRMPV